MALSNWKWWIWDLGFGTGYKRCGVAARRREKHQRSEREHQRASESEREEETCCLWACVVNRDCVITILRSVGCSSESTTGLCEHPRALSSLSTRTTALLWTIQESLWTFGTPLASTKTKDKASTLLGHYCVWTFLIREPIKTVYHFICTSPSLCILYVVTVTAIDDLFTITYT